MSETNGKQKRKKLFNHVFSKRKKKDKKRSKTDPNDYQEPEDELHPQDIQTKPYSLRTVTTPNNISSKPPIDDDTKLPEASITNTEIDTLVHKMKSILTKLAALHRSTHHSMDLERFHKLIEWVDYNESHLNLLEQAWNDSSFWPFLSTTEATDQVKKDKETMLIRLSNTKPGAITVTRMAKGMGGYVKHKRYFPSEQFGRLTLEGSWGKRQVTWDGLLSHLKQKECCICLEELTENMVLRLNCGHHFHRKCIELHVQHSMQTNGTEFAVCPLCRKQIENAELIREPSFSVYKRIPDVSKSKSFDGVSKNRMKGMTQSEEDLMRRAFSAEAEIPPNWKAFGNNSEVNGDMDEDDYGNVAQVRKQYNRNLGVK